MLCQQRLKDTNVRLSQLGTPGDGSYLRSLATCLGGKRSDPTQPESRSKQLELEPEDAQINDLLHGLLGAADEDGVFSLRMS